MQDSFPAPGKLGVYIHVPFCAGGKCPYCDFYSVPLSDPARACYMAAAAREIRRWGRVCRGRRVDTVYFGGGTPSLLGEGLAELLGRIREEFDVEPDAEVTFEANPAPGVAGCFPALRAAGFNRLSLGLQSADPEELRLLGRRHTPRDAADAVHAAREAGFANISLDLMLATPGQTPESLRRSIAFAASLGPAHVSAYLLKVEPGTAFYRKKDTLGLPDDDTQAAYYRLVCQELEACGFRQYEISNFARPGYESRHNLRYWDGADYIGIGPGAHSLLGGRRFYYPPRLADFTENGQTEDEGPGGSYAEYAMLRLRLTAGLSESELRRRYGAGFEWLHMEKVPALARAGLMTAEPGRLALTVRGFLVSNSILSELLP